MTVDGEVEASNASGIDETEAVPKTSRHIYDSKRAFDASVVPPETIDYKGVGVSIRTTSQLSDPSP